MGFAHWNVPHISLAPARGGSHRKDVGRILFWKRTRPTPRKKSTRAFRLRPGPPTTQRPGASAPAFGNQPPRGRGTRARPLPFGNPSRGKTGERQRKEKQRVSYLHPEASCDYQHGVQDLISSAPRPCYAGTDKSLGRTVENRIPQTCACCKFGQKRLFSSTVHGAFSFPQEEKRMGGVFQ